MAICQTASAAPKFKLINSTLKLRAVKVAGDLRRPVGAYFPPNDDSRMFVIEQHTGKVVIQDMRRNERIERPFLTINDLSTKNEQGLLGFAFHPKFNKKGYRHVFVHYTRRDMTSVIERYTVSKRNKNLADPRSRKTILTISQPYENHNGGWIGFGPDGYLYIAIGDGGGQWDVGPGHDKEVGNGQDITNNLLAKILRIDIDSDSYKRDKTRNYGIPKSNPFRKRTGDPEIWAFGLRNVWRASFDMKTGDFYMGGCGAR